MKDIWKKCWFWVLIVLTIFIIVIGIRIYIHKKQVQKGVENFTKGINDYVEAYNNAKSRINDFSYNYEKEEWEKTSTTWLQKYNSIEKGMTKNEVEAILGEGYFDEIASIKDEGIFIYSWGKERGLEEGQVIVVSFKENLVESKAQIGLK